MMNKTHVAPLAGAWIETLPHPPLFRRVQRSRPSRARGLKRELDSVLARRLSVAPLAGAWIETIRKERHVNRLMVAPLAGAWIETYLILFAMSDSPICVAPLAGAWIETYAALSARVQRSRRAPRGRVD